MLEATRELVRERAAHRCEYCHLHQSHSELTHHVEHIIARQHGGSSEIGNLALACHRCNLHKGPNLTAVDPETGAVVHLFHPRTQQWADHFSLVGIEILGLSGTGRATVRLLSMNDARRLELRQLLEQRVDG